MDIKWLEGFLVLAETRSFSRAAEDRHITQPAFGRHIRALENFVGKELVDRSTIPVGLTPEGVQFKTVARNIIAQIREGVSLINGESERPEQPVTIASPHAFASPALLDLIDISGFSEQPPGVKVDTLRVEQAAESLIEGRCDFLLAYDVLSLMQPPFENLFLGQGDYLLVSATGATGKPLYWHNQSRLPFLNYSSESYSARLLERLPPMLADIDHQPVFETSMCQLQKEMALRGRGVAWLPDCLIREELKQGALVAINPEQWRAPYQIRLYRNNARVDRFAEQFWAEIEKQVASGWQVIQPWSGWQQS